jgi:hypothetical protein
VRKANAVQYRLTEEQKQIVTEIAKSTGVEEADVVRWAVQALGDYYRHHGNRLVLPLRFTETFSVQTIRRRKSD